MSEQATTIRDGTVADIPFIASSWKQSYKFGSPWAHRIRWSVFSDGHSPIIEGILASCHIAVACSPTDKTEILGYLVSEPSRQVIHYAYVKPPFRLAGICRALLKRIGYPPDLRGCSITHATQLWFASFAEKYPSVVHNPYLAFFTLKE